MSDLRRRRAGLLIGLVWWVSGCSSHGEHVDDSQSRSKQSSVEQSQPGGESNKDAVNRGENGDGSAVVGTDSKQGAQCQPNQQMSELLAAVNRARAESRSCGGKGYSATHPLQYNCSLERAAQAHTEDMAAHGQPSHDGSDGSTLLDRVRRVDYVYRAIRENVAAGQRSVDEVVNDWLNSPSHCRNIMDGGNTEMGAGFVSAPNVRYQTYWTLVLGAPLE